MNASITCNTIRVKGIWLVLVLGALVVLSCRAPALLLNEAEPGRETIRGSGDIRRENRPVSSFERLEIAGIGQVWITQGRAYSLVVEADDNLLPLLETRVIGSTLFIGLTEEARNKNLRPSEGINFYVQMPELASMEIVGSADVRAESLDAGRLDIVVYGSGDVDLQTLTAERLEVTIAGSGVVEIQACRCDQVEASVPGSGEIWVAGMRADEVDVSIAGSGYVELSGQTSRQEINIGGSGSYRGGDLESFETQVRIGGSGKVETWATETLDIRIPGSGSVRYYGRPQVSRSILGSGSVTSLGDH